ncbi:MAG: pyridoxal phosphate-dependent aminotransferase [Chitinophagaceae bacterium]
MSTTISTLLDRFNEPETLRMAKLARELRGSGVDVIDLSLGEPDFDTPQHIKQAAIDAINNNYSHYTPVPGYVDVREAICYKLKEDNNLEYKPENIVTSTGAKQCLANVILALVDEGDEVIIPTPFWVTYSELVKIARGKVVALPSTIESNFKITAQQLKEAITDKSKVFLFSSPCNPSGAVYSKEELASLVEVFKQYPQITIISDEIYEYINFVDKHYSIASFDGMQERTVIINGLSKGFAMTGWRFGYSASNVAIAKACEKLQGQFTSATCSITQRAAITALTSSKESCVAMKEEFAKRKAIVLDLVKDIPGIICNNPEGAFYIFPDVSFYFGKSYNDTTITNSADFSLYLLHQAHVSSVMGEAFGNPNCVRFSFANTIENIQKAWARIKDALSKLK